MHSEDQESLVLFLIHDLEGPLAAMQTMLRLLDGRRFDPASKLHAQLLQSTHAAMDRARLIVSDLLSVSKLEQDSLVIAWEEFPLTETVNESVKLALAASTDQDVTVQVTPFDQELIARADRKLLSRVIDNVLFNAVRHADPGSRVRLSVEDGVEQIIIRVTNSGEGLGALDPNELFEKFKQVRHRRNSNHRGVGLGLYFCKLAVTAMQGEIKAFNTDAGETCFSISVLKGGYAQ